MSNTYIDIGSTSIKWCQDDSPIKRTAFPEKKELRPPYFEVSIKKIWKIIRDIIGGVEKGNVFISVQMHGYVLLSMEGEELTDYISWQDCRSKLVDVPFTLKPENGVALKPNLPKAGVHAIKVLQPQLYKNVAEFCTLGSYLAKKLTGINKTHITDAAPSGFYNIKTLKGEAVFAIPQVAANVEPVGRSGENVIYTPVGDQQAAVFGSYANEDCYVMNLGTAGQLCCINSGFIEGDFESRPFFGGKTLCTVSGLPGGKVIGEKKDDWTRHFHDEYAAAMEKLPKRSSVYVIGGFAKQYKRQLSSIFDSFGLPYRFSNKEDALEGLKRIANNLFNEVNFRENAER